MLSGIASGVICSRAVEVLKHVVGVAGDLGECRPSGILVNAASPILLPICDDLVRRDRSIEQEQSSGQRVPISASKPSASVPRQLKPS
jgi:hypothetical protein